MAYKNVILALSGKDDESKVIAEAIKLTRQLDAKLTAVHVNDPDAGKPSMMMDAPQKTDEQDIREEFRKAGFEKEAESIKIRLMEGESYSEKISEISETADLLILGHSHKSRFLEALSETLDEEIANTAKCPVIIVPKKD